MESLADSTTITYNKLPPYLQPYHGSPNNCITAYSHVGYTPVGYTTATVSVPHTRSTHREQSTAEDVDEPHLSGCGITPSPSDSTSSLSPDENGSSKETLFRPISFERLSSGVQKPQHTSSVAVHVVPLTPSDSAAESSDRESHNEDRLPEVLLVRIPRKAPATVTIEPAEDNCANGASSSSPAPTSPTSADEITVSPQDRELWQTFKSIGNEMIVTKPGRWGISLTFMHNNQPNHD